MTGAQNLTLQNNGATANGITISGGSLNNTGTVINSGTGASQSAGVLISAAIGANVTSLTQNSATSFLRLSGTNLYTGNTIVTAGALTYLTTNTKSSTLTTVAANATLGLGVSGANAFASADVDSLFAGTLSGVTNDAASLAGIDTSNGDFTYASNITGGRGMHKLGVNVLTLTGNNSAGTGPMIVASGGTLRVGAASNFTTGTLTLAGTATASTLDLRNDASTDFAKTVTLASPGISGSTAVPYTINVDQAVGGVGSGNTHTIAAISQATAGSRSLTVGGANGYALSIGSFNLSPGTGQNTTLTANVNVTFGNVNNPMSGFGASNFDTLTIVGSSTASSITGVIADAVGGSQTAGGYTRLVKGGGGTWTLANANTYSGKTFINQGTLNVTSLNSVNVGGASSLGAPTTASFGTIDFGSGALTAMLNYTNPISETTDRVINLTGGAGAIATLSQSGIGALKFTSAFTATGTGASKTLVLSGSTAGTGEIAGAVVNNSPTTVTALTKDGTGTWTLSGINTYTGATTVSNGTLAMGAVGTAGGTLDATAVTVNSGGTFAVRPGVTTTSNNSIGSTLTMNAGSALTMADGFSNTVNVAGAANLYAGSVGAGPAYTFNLSGMSGVSDVLAIGGAASFGNPGGLLSFVPQAALTISDTYTVATAASGLDGANAWTLANAGRTAFGNTAYTLSLANNATSTVVTVTGSGAAFAYYSGSRGTTLNATSGALTNWATDVTGVTDAGVQPNAFTDVSFSTTGATNLTVATLGQNFTFNSLNFNNAAGAVTINDTGSNTITVNGGITVESGAPAEAVNVPIILGAAQTWANNSVNALTVNGAISGSGGITKTGNGTLVLSGANNYASPTTVSAGTLSLTGSLSGTVITVSGTGVFSESAAGSIIGASSFVHSIGGTTVLGGTNSYSGDTAINAGTLQFKGAGSLSSATAIKLGAGTLQIRDDGAGSNGTISHTGNSISLPLATTAATIDVGNDGANTGNTVAFGALNNGTPASAFLSTINFTGSNGYLQSYTSLGLSGLTGQNTTLNPTTTSVTITGNVTNQLSGDMTAHFDTLTLGGTSTGNAINGVISDNAGFVSVGNGDTRLTKTGASTWTLAGANTYSGPTTINGGTLILSGGSSATSGITINGGTGTTLLVSNAGATGAGSIMMQTGVTNANLQFHINGGGIITLPNALGGNSSVTTTIDVDNNGSGSNGVIQLTGSLASSAIGNATLNITGANGYSLRMDNLRNTGGAAGTLLVNPTTAPVSIGNVTVDPVASATTGTYIFGLGGTNTGNIVTGLISNNANGPALSAVTKSNTGTWTLSGANTYTGTTTISAGTLKAGSALAFTNKGTLTQSGTGVFDLDGFGASFTIVAASTTGNIITNSGGADATLNVSSNGTMITINSLITDGPAKKLALSFGNQNSGVTLIKGDSPNTFSGGVTLLDGSAIGTGTGTRLRIQSLITTVGTPGAIVSSPFGTGAITLGLAATDKAGMLFDVVPNNALVNDIIVNTAQGTDQPGIRVDANAAGLTLSGKITANLANAKFSGTGTVSLTGQVTGAFGIETNTSFATTVTLNNAADNTNYLGSTIIGAASTLALGRADQIPNGSGKGDMLNAGNLKLNGFSETINGLSGAGTVDGVSGAPIFTLGDNSATGNDFSGVIKNTADNLTLRKIGTGTQTLSGVNTYTGGTAVNNGTLILNGADTGTGVIRGAVNINSGATMRLASANALGYNTGVRVDTVNINGGTLDDVVNGNQGFNQTYNLTGGTMRANGGVSSPTANQWFAFGSGFGGTTAVNTIASAATSAIEGRVIFRNDNLNTNINFTVANGAAATDLLVSAAITQNAGLAVGLTKAGAGLMQLTGTNSYAGLTSITNGILSIAASAHLGDASATNTIAINGGTLQDTGAGVNLGANRSVAIGASGGTVDVAAASDLTIPGVISGAGNTLTKTGSGTLKINGAQTYGTLTTGAGRTDVNSALGTGTSTVNANATTNISTSQTLAALNIGAGAVVTFSQTPPPFAGFRAGVVPEPSSGVLLLSGLGALLALRRRRV